MPPATGSPFGDCGANRSYRWSCPPRTTSARCSKRSSQISRDRASFPCGPELNKISLQPLLLRRACLHRDVAVQRNDVPFPEIEAVVTHASGAGHRAEVSVVPLCARRFVVVIAWRRARPREVPAPRRGIAVFEVRQRSRWVSVVSRGEHRARKLVEEPSRRLRTCRPAPADVATSDEHSVLR